MSRCRYLDIRDYVEEEFNFSGIMDDIYSKRNRKTNTFSLDVK